MLPLRNRCEKPHHHTRHQADHDRGDIAAKSKFSVSGHESADITAQVGADQSDEHCRHRGVSKTCSGCLLSGGFPALTLILLRIFFFRFPALQPAGVPLIEEKRQHHTPHNADTHQQRDGAERTRCHVLRREPADADSLRCSFCHLRLIMKRTDHRQPQPWPWRSQAARQRNDAEQNADARQKRKSHA